MIFTFLQLTLIGLVRFKYCKLSVFPSFLKSPNKNQLIFEINFDTIAVFLLILKLPIVKLLLKVKEEKPLVFLFIAIFLV